MGSKSYITAYANDISDVSNVSIEKVLAVVNAMPDAIQTSVVNCREVNCALFKASRSAKGIKYLPHGHMRTPLLLGNVQPTPIFIESIAQCSGLSIADVESIASGIVSVARRNLGRGDGAFYIIPNVCRLYVDNGRIRITTNPKAMDANYAT